MNKFIFFLILGVSVLFFFKSTKAQDAAPTLSQSYTCDGYIVGQRIQIPSMARPVIAYIERLGRWVTFERGEVLLDGSINHYFTYEGEWVYNYLPFIGDIVKIPDGDAWRVVEVSGLGISIWDAFIIGFFAPNCWSN